MAAARETDSRGASVVAVVVTYRREAELGRLLESLRLSTSPLTACVVVDHAAEEGAATVVANASMPTLYVPCAQNPGPGAGWKLGMEMALREHPGLTHFLVLDDDVVLPPEAVDRMVRALDSGKVMACPMLLDDGGRIWGFPEPLDPALRGVIRQVATPQDAIRLLGREPLEFAWCTGACVLVSREAVERAGFHRVDFWMLGEDLEFSMRMSQAGGGVFLPEVFVPHLPPSAIDPVAARQADRVKFCSLLQNLAWLAFHSPHSRHLKTYLPGNVKRYFLTHGWHWKSLRDVAWCLWFGAVRGQPAGRESGTRLRECVRRGD